MKLKIVITLSGVGLCSYLLFKAFSGEFPNEYTNPLGTVPFVRILAIPEQFHMQRVSTSGVFSMDRNDAGLFLDHASSQYGIMANAVYLDLTEVDNAELKVQDYAGKYVYLHGTIDAFTHGPLKVYTATLKVKNKPKIYTISER